VTRRRPALRPAPPHGPPGLTPTPHASRPRHARDTETRAMRHPSRVFVFYVWTFEFQKTRVATLGTGNRDRMEGPSGACRCRLALPGAAVYPI
jgi:hypothetical protein